MPSISEKISRAIQKIECREYTAAHNGLAEILKENPEHPDANHLLAIALLRAGEDPQRALHFAESALAQNPDEPIFLNTLGSCLFNVGELEQSIQILNRTLSLKPDYSEALFNLGSTQLMLGDPVRALESYENALSLEPHNLDYLDAAGNSAVAAQRYSRAIGFFSLASELAPLRTASLIGLSRALVAANQVEKAIKALEDSSQINPKDETLWITLGNCHKDKENYPSAIECFKTALDIAPSSIDALFALGITLSADRQFRSACDVFEQILELSPGRLSAQLNKANCLYRLNQLQEAQTIYENAIRRHPDSEHPYAGLAHIHRRAGDLPKALEYYVKALQKRPTDPGLHFAKSLVLLKMGKFREGWRHYEWRPYINKGLRTEDSWATQNIPSWTGEDLAGKTLLVRGEQGLGDIVHFCRYLDVLNNPEVTIKFYGAKALHKLLSTMKSDFEICRAQSIFSVTADYQVSLLSLPHILRTTRESIPSHESYFFLDDDDVGRWRCRLDPTKLNIGIAWAGNPRQAENHDRSCRLSDLKPLIDLAEVQAYSLQKGHGSEQLTEGGATYDVIDFTAELDDYYDTACLMRSLDLVVTIDTSVAHVAGAVGAPVWTMLWYAHCWRYMQVRDDSPWYPSMRLFRQTSLGDWQGVVQQITTALKNFPGPR